MGKESNKHTQVQLGIIGEIIRIRGGKNVELTKELKKGFKTCIKGKGHSGETVGPLIN